MEEILNSPSNKQFLSPKASKKSIKKQKSSKSKVRKSNKKVSKFNRKASMSPSNENLLNNKSQKFKNKFASKPTFKNRRSMNDLNVDKNIPINILTNNYVKKKGLSEKVVTIQKYLRGYLVYKIVQKYRQDSKLKTIEDSKREDKNLEPIQIQRMNSDSSNTLERATNQNDILKAMIVTRQESEGHNSGSASDYYSEKLPKEDIKIDIKPKLKLIQKRVKEHRKNSSDNILSKSASNIEKSNEQNSQTIKLEVRNNQIKFLKKRPNSAKSIENKPTDNKSRTETDKKLHEIFEKFKTLQNNKKSKTEEFKLCKSKPPMSTRIQRNEKSDPNHKSSDSLSDKFSQMSPSNGSFKPFSDEKYQRLIKNQIYVDYKNKKNEVNNKFSRKMDRFEALFNQKMISSDSFERHRNTLEEWKEKNYKKLEKKRNN